MLRLTVLVSGGGTNLQAILDAMEAGQIPGATVAAVISNNAGAYALERARKHGIAAECVAPKDFESRKDFHRALLARLQFYQTDLVVLAGYLVAVPPEIVAAYPNRILNIHPSLIPAFCGTGYYGLRVHEEALKRGVKVTGATVHFVDTGTDTGPIFLQKAVEVRPEDTPKSLQKRVMEEAEWKLLPAAIALLAAGRVQVRNGKVLLDDGIEQ